MIKKLTLRLDERMMESLLAQVKKNGFSSYNEYFRFLLSSPSQDRPWSGNESIALMEELSALDDRLRKVEETIDVVLRQAEVNGKALMVLLSFFDLEAIPAKGLEHARQFLALKMLEIKSGR